MKEEAHILNPACFLDSSPLDGSDLKPSGRSPLSPLAQQEETLREVADDLVRYTPEFAEMLKDLGGL